MSRQRVSLILLFLLALFTLCKAESFFDNFWKDEVQEKPKSTDSLKEVEEEEEKINIQTEMLNRMSEEQPALEIRNPLVGLDALEKVKGGPLPHVMLQAFDTDGDGVLSPEERAKIDKKAWMEFHKTMKSKAAGAINNAMPTLKEMKMRLQHARYQGEVPQDILNKQQLQNKIDAQLKAAMGKPTVDPHPGVRVDATSTDLHKRSLEHARQYQERNKNSNTNNQ